MIEVSPESIIYGLVLILLFSLNWWFGRWLVGRVVGGMPGGGTREEGPGAGAKVG